LEGTFDEAVEMSFETKGEVELGVAKPKEEGKRAKASLVIVSALILNKIEDAHPKDQIGVLFVGYGAEYFLFKSLPGVSSGDDCDNVIDLIHTWSAGLIKPKREEMVNVLVTDYFGTKRKTWIKKFDITAEELGRKLLECQALPDCKSVYIGLKVLSISVNALKFAYVLDGSVEKKWTVNGERILLGDGTIDILNEAFRQRKI